MTSKFRFLVPYRQLSACLGNLICPKPVLLSSLFSPTETSMHLAFFARNPFPHFPLSNHHYVLPNFSWTLSLSQLSPSSHLDNHVTAKTMSCPQRSLSSSHILQIKFMCYVSSSVSLNILLFFHGTSQFVSYVTIVWCSVFLGRQIVTTIKAVAILLTTRPRAPSTVSG